jgi:LPPG:FO 2-phospho-L-lactate transferase
MLDVVGSDELAVVANTGDDLEIYGAYVSPDPDLITFWLADQIDERGWGLRGDTFSVMEGLRDLGVDAWFNLGDRDLAIGIERQRALRAGRRLTEAQSDIARALDVRAQVLPMSDHPVRTTVMAHDRWWAFQEFMIRGAGRGPVQDVDFRGAGSAPASPEVIDAIARARAVVIGPSNPVISIGPILAIPAIGDALKETTTPVVAVSPIVDGEVLKGPTGDFMHWAGATLDSDGVATSYAGVIDGLVADQRAAALPTLTTNTLMHTPAARRQVARQALEFALALGGRG